MDLHHSKSALLYFEDKSYIEKTFRQIKRDFEMTGLYMENEDILPTSYAALYSIVLFNIHSLIRADNIQLKNLLYRIDVSEKEIHKRMASKTDAKLQEEISSLIIERCLLKVLTREKYSS